MHESQAVKLKLTCHFQIFLLRLEWVLEGLPGEQTLEHEADDLSCLLCSVTTYVDLQKWKYLSHNLGILMPNTLQLIIWMYLYSLTSEGPSSSPVQWHHHMSSSVWRFHLPVVHYWLQQIHHGGTIGLKQQRKEFKEYKVSRVIELLKVLWLSSCFVYWAKWHGEKAYQQVSATRSLPGTGNQVEVTCLTAVLSSTVQRGKRPLFGQKYVCHAHNRKISCKVFACSTVFFLSRHRSAET